MTKTPNTTPQPNYPDQIIGDKTQVGAQASRECLQQSAEVAREIMRFNVRGGMINPESRGMYVRYEDHVAALQAAPPAPAAVAVPDTLVADARRLAYVADQVRALEVVGSDNDVYLTEAADVLRACADRIAAPAQAQEDARDAGRYQALRDESLQVDEDDPCVMDSSFGTYFGEELDNAADKLCDRRAARAAQGGAA